MARHAARGTRPEAVDRALAAVEQAQRAALEDPPRGRFVFVRMNPAAGLGNRLVAMVSALLLAAATERGLLVDWESYSEPRTHRSLEVSTMAPLEHFFDLPFACDASALLGTPQAQRAFGWDYQQWRQVGCACPPRRRLPPAPRRGPPARRTPRVPPPSPRNALCGRPRAHMLMRHDVQMHDENVADMHVLHTSDVNAALPQRVVVVSAISYFGQLLLANPFAAPRLAPLKCVLFGRDVITRARTERARGSERGGGAGGGGRR